MKPWQRTARRAEVIAELARPDGDAHRSHSQDAAVSVLTEELAALESADTWAEIERVKEVDHLRSVAGNPANVESGNGTRIDGTPALVGNRNRVETADEIVKRSGNPWRPQDGPVSWFESAAGLVSRANTALGVARGHADP
jgi:hypothetical protein